MEFPNSFAIAFPPLNENNGISNKGMQSQSLNHCQMKSPPQQQPTPSNNSYQFQPQFLSQKQTSSTQPMQQQLQQQSQSQQHQNMSYDLDEFSKRIQPIVATLHNFLHADIAAKGLNTQLYDLVHDRKLTL